MTARRILPLLLCLIGFAPLPAARAADAEKPVRLLPDAKDLEVALGTDWYGVYFNGKKVGYFQSVRTRTGKGADAAYVESSDLRMKLVSFGQKSELKMRQVLEFDARPPYALRRGDVTETDGRQTQRYRLARSGQGFTFTYTAGKEQRTKQVPAIDYTLADSLSEELWIRRGARQGDRIVTCSFDVKDLEVDLTSSKLVATKTSQVKGVPVTYHEVASVSRKAKLSGLSRHDATGRLLSGTLAGVIELRLEPEAQARNTEYSTDLFVQGMVKIDKALGPARDVAGLVVEVVGKEGALIPAGPRQAVAPAKSGPVVLRLGKKYGTPVRATGQEVKDALAETLAYPAADPQVRALAKQAVGDARTPREKVRRLVEFVNDFITPTLNVNQPNLYDLLERKKGDCKSYALLFTTLARAAGIPAREVGGVVYMGDDVKAFGGHAWNEVVLDGHWVPVDASSREPEVNATHISFGSDAAATGNMVATLGKLSLRLIRVDRAE